MLNLIDVGGNTGSLKRCLDRLGLPYRGVREGPDLRPGEPVVLPGVGAFGAFLRELRGRGLAAPIAEAARAGTPVLGICVGMQALFEGSEESPGEPGLGLLAGPVRRFRRGKVPQVGWNRVAARQDGGWEEGWAYFVHGYRAEPEDRGATLYESEYHGPFCAAVRSGALTGFQFHPEKSGEFGAAVLGRWRDAL